MSDAGKERRAPLRRAAFGRSRIIISAITDALRSQLQREPTRDEVHSALRTRREAATKYRTADKAERSRIDAALASSSTARKIRELNRQSKEFWSKPETQVAHAWIASAAAQKARDTMRAKPGADAKRALAKKEQVRKAAATLLLKHPHLTRDQVAEKICTHKSVSLSFWRTVKILTSLKLFARKKSKTRE